MTRSLPLSSMESTYQWTQPESISERLRRWSESAPPWEEAEFCRERTLRFLRRTASMQHHLGKPLVVALLGGTGTGKSTLLNALVGEKAVREGKERPTTDRPILVCHSSVDPAEWGADLSGILLEKRDAPALEQMAILDCPDPDTTENAELSESNSARLRAALPLCDILLVTATQQKYRSHTVLDELAKAAPGARLVFVQTHAERDDDIREDWAKLLEKQYRTGRIYFVDSVAALTAQQENRPVGEEFSGLRELLTRELNEEAAIRIRQENYFGLAEETVRQCREEIERQWTPVRLYREHISEERRRFGERMAEKMRDDLIRDQRLWESRLVGRVASQWGFSPFSLLLRLYQNLGALFSGLLFVRAVRHPTQLAVWGAFEGVRTFRNWSGARKVKKRPVAAVTSSWEDGRLRESALILTGFASDAGMPTDHCEPEYVLDEAREAGETFISDIAGELEQICDRLARKKNRLWKRLVYEILFGGMLLFLLIRPAKNFFIDSFLYKEPLFGASFYVVSLFWLLAWGGLLLGFFMFMLRRGLDREVGETASKWGRLPSLELLFATMEQETNRVMAFRDELTAIDQRIARIRQQSEKLDRRLGRKKNREES